MMRNQIKKQKIRIGRVGSSTPPDDGIQELFHRCINNSLLLIQIDDDEFNQLLKYLSNAKGRHAFAYALYTHKLRIMSHLNAYLRVRSK